MFNHFLKHYFLSWKESVFTVVVHIIVAIMY